MKNAAAIATLAMIASSLVAETLRIGAFNLPYRFEDTNLTDIVRYVVTNDVIAYKSATTSFTPPFVEENGNVTVDSESTPSATLYLPSVFENGIEFRIEGGQTNCVIRQSLTDAAKAIEGELPTRTNLVAVAQGFIENFSSGGTTNLTISEQRTLMRTVSGDHLLTMGPDIPDEDVLEAQGEMRQHFSFLPICILDTRYVNVGTNVVLLAYVRTDRPQTPSYVRSIGALSLVFFDGYWSFLY